MGLVTCFSRRQRQTTETRVYDNHCRPFGRCLSTYSILIYSYLLAHGQHGPQNSMV
jgi:hypothetical protein